MPVKVCPKCNLRHGCRRLICECGHVFKQAASQAVPESIEPGLWIWDQPKGMPPIYRPEPLPPGPLTNEVIKERITYEGLGYVIFSLVKADRIADLKLRKLWSETRKALQAIVEYLG